MRFQTFFLIISVLVSFSAPKNLAGSTIDSRTLSPNAVTTRIDLNGIGETFVADAPFLQDASILVATPNAAQAGFGIADLWQHAKIELRLGFPQSFTGTANVIFRSGDVNLATLPLLGQVSFALFFDVRELKLSAVGLVGPTPLIVGGTYTLDMIDLSGDATKYIGYLETFTLGLSSIAHNRSYSDTFWASGSGLSSMIAMVPEPSSLMLSAFGFIGLASWGWRRRR